MTATSVKDVSTVMSTGIAGPGSSVGVAPEVSFQSVLSNQTNRNQSSEEVDEQNVSGGKSDSQKVRPQDEVLKAKETARKPVKNAESKKADGNEITEEQTEKALEVLGTAAAEMIRQVADTLGMSVEEVQQLMTDLGMDTLDVLNPEKLSSLLLDAAGAEDSMALLTNEALYGDFKQVMTYQQNLMQEVGNELQVSDVELMQLLNDTENAELISVEQAGISENVTDIAEETVIEITVDDEASEDTQTKDTVEADDNIKNNLQDIRETPTAQETSGKAQTHDREEHHGQKDNDRTGNLILQELKAKPEGMQPEVNVVQTSTVWDADSQDIMRQIMDYMKIRVKPDMSDLEMQLHPESLGKLQIHVSSKGGVVTANFVTQNEAVKAALESQMVQLKESFAEQGMKVESIEVTVQTHQFERNLDQGRGSNQGEPTKKGRTRRINLNVDAGLEETAEMTQEEMLAAELMSANGNTVDYTA